MLKNIFIKCSEIIRNDELTKTLKTVNSFEEIESEQIQLDAYRMLQYFNYVCETIFTNYIELIENCTCKSDDEGKIYFNSLYHTPIKILDVKISNRTSIHFESYHEYIKIDSKNTTCEVRFRYCPRPAKKLSEQTNFPVGIERIIIYGVVEEFLACKGLYNESDFWHNKFMLELFKFKTHRERRLRSTFCR